MKWLINLTDDVTKSYHTFNNINNNKIYLIWIFIKICISKYILFGGFTKIYTCYLYPRPMQFCILLNICLPKLNFDLLIKIEMITYNWCKLTKCALWSIFETEIYYVIFKKVKKLSFHNYIQFWSNLNGLYKYIHRYCTYLNVLIIMVYLFYLVSFLCMNYQVHP